MKFLKHMTIFSLVVLLLVGHALSQTTEEPPETEPTLGPTDVTTEQPETEPTEPPETEPTVGPTNSTPSPTEEPTEATTEETTEPTTEEPTTTQPPPSTTTTAPTTTNFPTTTNPITTTESLCNHTAPDNIDCPIDAPEGIPTYLPYPYDCTRFIVCTNGEPEAECCPVGTRWVSLFGQTLSKLMHTAKVVHSLLCGHDLEFVS